MVNHGLITGHDLYRAEKMRKKNMRASWQNEHLFIEIYIFFTSKIKKIIYTKHGNEHLDLNI